MRRVRDQRQEGLSGLLQGMHDPSEFCQTTQATYERIPRNPGVPDVRQKIVAMIRSERNEAAVSYTHLTLPTIYSV